MNSKWANRILFWTLAAIVPGVSFLIIARFYGSAWFSLFFFMYLLLYRPFINIARLHSLKAMEEKDLWKLFIPLYEGRYRRILWLG